MKSEYNTIKEALKKSNEITEEWTTLHDLGSVSYYKNVIVSSTLNKPVQVKFKNDESIITVFPNRSYSLDNFIHNGKIEAKYFEQNATEGLLQVVSYGYKRG